MAMSKENNTILPKDIKKRIYKSRKQRPCDNCRKRKSCCIIENGIPCKLCKMFNKKCTFEKGPVYNNEKKKKDVKKVNATMVPGAVIQGQAVINNYSMAANSPLTPSTSASSTHSSLSIPNPSHHHHHHQIMIKQEIIKQEDEEEGLSSAGPEYTNEDNSFYNDYNFFNGDTNSQFMMAQTSTNSYNQLSGLSASYDAENEYDNSIGLGNGANFENFLNNMPLDMDMNMNMDSLNFQAGFFDFSLEYEQMR